MLYNRDLKEQVSKGILNEWEWLTEGVDNFNEKLNLSILLQNAKESMSIQNGLNEGYIEKLLTEDVETSSMTSFAGGSDLIPKVVFPMIRRVFPNLIANKLIGIQPLTRPTGIIYYLAYLFSNTKANITAGDEYDAFPWDGNTNGGYDAYYSSNRVGPFLTPADGTTVTAINLDTFFSQSSIDGATTSTISGVEVYDAATGQGLSATYISNDTTPAAGIVYAKPDGTEIASGTFPGVTNVNVFVIYNQEASENIPEMQLTVKSMPVNTKERKLRVRWTKESEQDFKAYHQIDIENELVKAASQEMTYELDREIINFIGAQVIPDLKFLHDWTADAPTTGNNAQGNYLDRHRALADKILRVSAKIATYNRQGPANWIVCSPQVGAILSQLPQFKTEINGAGGNYNVKYMGKLYGNIDVYVDPVKLPTSGFAATTTSKNEEILIGYYGGSNNPYASGVIYSPYTNWMSNEIVHPDNFNSVRGFFSRYGITKVVRGEYYYGKVTINNLTV